MLTNTLIQKDYLNPGSIFYLLLIAGFFIPSLSFSQEDNWDAYMANYAGKPGSTLVNMSLHSRGPLPSHPFIIVTGVKYKNCKTDGFPVDQEFEKLYEVSNAVSEKLNALTKPIMAGTFTFECERLDYFYLPDTTGIRNAVAELYKSQFASYNFSINIKPDNEWKGYFDFLYPNEITQEFMGNQKVLAALSEAGDKLIGTRKLEHRAYFKESKGRDCFIQYLKMQNYTIDKTEFRKDLANMYTLHFSRVDKVDLNSITDITLDMRKTAKKCVGLYNGWETQLIK